MSVAIGITHSWPVTLPLPFIDHTGASRVPTLVSPESSAKIRRRKRWNQAYATANVTFKFSSAQWVTFIAFWDTTLGSGTAKFSVELRYPKISQLDTHIVRFLGSLEVSDRDDIYEVSATLGITTLAVVDDKATVL